MGQKTLAFCANLPIPGMDHAAVLNFIRRQQAGAMALGPITVEYTSTSDQGAVVSIHGTGRGVNRALGTSDYRPSASSAPSARASG